MKKDEKIEKMGFSLISQKTKIVPDVIEKQVSGKDYVFYGDDNDFPEYLWNLYLKSSVLQSIINGTVDYISGNEVVSRLDIVNKEGETINDIIRKITTDYMIFGGFAIQIIRDFNGDVRELYWLDIRKVRVNDEGDRIFYCDKWNKYGAKAIEYERFDSEKKQSTSVFYYKGHITRGVYPIPRYCGALSAIETSTEIGKFHLNNILNNLTSSAIINFNNGVPSKEQQSEIERKISDKFSGADNAGKFILTFNNNKESAVTVERLNEDNMDAKFQTLSKSTMQEIFISFRATPSLFGLNPENNGFSKEEFLESFELYNKTCVIPSQKDIVRCFEKIYNEENIIQFIPFKLDEI